MKWLRIGSTALLACAFVSCKGLDDLTDLKVINNNDPDRARVIQQASDVEALLASAMQRVWSGINNSGSPGQALNTTADEITVSWGNYGAQDLSSEPRTAFNNSPSYRYSQLSERPWYTIYEGLSDAFDFFKSIEAQPELCDEIDCDRGRAFAKFVQGLGHGFLAMMYDSAFVLDETVPLEFVPGQNNAQLLESASLKLQGHQAVFAAAHGFFDASMSLAAGASWKLPEGWIGVSGDALTGNELVQLVNAQLARWEPQLARNPTERAAVDWAEVISHVDNAITENFFVESDADQWWSANLYFNFINFADNSWSRADYKTIGQYDTSGNYSAWLADFNGRTDIAITTPDRRVIGDAGATSEGLYFRNDGSSPFRSSRGRYHFSEYSGTRWEDWASTEVGPMPYILTAELQLNKAEGMLRNGGVTQAVVDLVNDTRVGNGEMTPLTITSTQQEVMDAIIYERRIEDYGMCTGCSFFNRRGEGPLSPTEGSPAGTHHQGPVVGTPLQFAPPGKELESLSRPIYTYGGPGNEGPTGASSPAVALDSDGGTIAPLSLVYVPFAERNHDMTAISRVTSLVRY